jgi:hypothetical protein
VTPARVAGRSNTAPGGFSGRRTLRLLAEFEEYLLHEMADGDRLKAALVAMA